MLLLLVHVVLGLTPLWGVPLHQLQPPSLLLLLLSLMLLLAQVVLCTVCMMTTLCSPTTVYPSVGHHQPRLLR